jgi:hypothetical protein
MDSIMEPNKAAHDLAQVRKLIEGMNALVNSQSHLQQQQKSEASEPTIAATSESAPQSPINNNTSMTDASNSLYSMSQLTTPLNTIIVEVNHLVFNRTLFFSLTRKPSLSSIPQNLYSLLTHLLLFSRCYYRTSDNLAETFV